LSRLSPRTRASRAILTLVVSGIVIGAVVEYRRTHRSQATPIPPKATVASVLPPPPGKTSGAAQPTSPIPLLSATTPQATTPPAAPVVTPVAAPASTSIAAVLAQAKVKANAGDLLGSRTLLNDALLAGGTSDADTAALKRQLTDLNNVLLFSGRTFPNDPLEATYKVVSGDRLSTIAKQHAVPYELLMELNHLTDPKKLRYGQSLKVINGPFYAVVTKSKFTLDLYLGAPGGEGSTFVASYPVGLGENNSTPTGMWEIKNKAPSPAYYSPRGEGVIPAGDPKNPLGPCWLGLEGTDGQAVGAESYGIHGTIDPTSIGKMASMGCVRLRNEDVTVVYKRLVEKKSKVKVLD
jgi:lipoprotein-anchoring transpeptidase ErfK/SrfK